MGDSLSATDVAGLANRDELAIRELANERGVVILPAPRTLVIANRSGFRDFVRQHLLAAPVGLVIDCTRTEYIDSSGLAILYSLAKESRRAEIGYCVACLSADLHTLLALTRIDVVLQTKDTLGEAILAASLDASPPARP